MKNTQPQEQRRNTGVLHCVQDDDVKQTTTSVQDDGVIGCFAQDDSFWVRVELTLMGCVGGVGLFA
jgi:hypothetical protein